ncbi:MAG: ABC transporter substrate-binding protein, partial [Desulfobacterales bacterium]|nr:ABC transporter substrate-binding protein [Desulfobacterales bacterium]
NRWKGPGRTWGTPAGTPDGKTNLRACVRPALIFLLTALLFLGCENPNLKSHKQRVRFAEKGQGYVAVAVVWPKESNLLFLKGVELAVEEVNREGGVLHRELRPIFFDEDADLGKEFNTKKVTANPRIVAVIGHRHSNVAISASIGYQYSGLIFLAPSATSPVLASHGFRLLFRTIPNDLRYGERVAQYAHRMGYKDILVLDNNTVYGKGLAEIFYSKASDLGLNIVTHKAFFQWQDNFRPLIDMVDELPFDAVFVGAVLPQAAILIKQFREMGVTVPFLGGDGLDDPTLIKIAGEAANGVVAPTPFNIHSSDPAFLNFKKAFQKKYQEAPDSLAAVGYDTMKLLAHVMNRANTTRPRVDASILRHEFNWKGSLGTYSFDQKGELTERDIFFTTVRGGRFVYTEE